MSIIDQLVTSDFQNKPYWLEDADLTVKNTDLPTSCDTVVIGAGYTGLHAAIQLRRLGKTVVVIEADRIAYGASCRNGGQVSTALKRGRDELARSYGQDTADAILQCGLDSQKFLENFLETEKLECDYSQCGHFLGAHKPNRIDGVRDWVKQHQALGQDARFVEADEMSEFTGSKQFCAGGYVSKWASIHPGKYSQGLIKLAQELAIPLLEQCRALKINHTSPGNRVETTRGNIHCGEVVVATNGYIDRVSRQQMRRIVPIASCMIATEKLDPELVRSLYPKNNMVYDTRKIVTYSRPSPDGERILLGSRVKVDKSNPESIVPRVHAKLTRLYPELTSVKVQYGWHGLVGFTMSQLPHIREEDSVHYVGGYCGTGIAMASYLGHCVANRINGESMAFGIDQIPVKPVPFYNGKPWFLPMVMAYYQVKDHL